MGKKKHTGVPHSKRRQDQSERRAQKNAQRQQEQDAARKLEKQNQRLFAAARRHW